MTRIGSVVNMNALTAQQRTVRRRQGIQWGQHPDLRASLMELLDRQQYTLADVGVMFGLSRERIRQYAVRYGIATHFGGLNAVRVWDDTLHQFRPVSRGHWQKIQKGHRTDRARQQRQAEREARRAMMVVCFTTEATRLGRPLTVVEMTRAWYGVNRNTGCLVGQWGAEGQRGSKGILPAIRVACGWPEGVTGSPGHTKPRKERLARYDRATKAIYRKLSDRRRYHWKRGNGPMYFWLTVQIDALPTQI
jgi:hypothetical protein